ncbi:probable pectate lyase 5 [Prosopis cineraria]|uniref:probable pectate lyase 5 n=1 Tax=Prosopis cineraria TaxID=364024 RepID=UPI0024109FD4|nr:probable pectate lyase 5 [Prosopis cineraria]
MRFLFNLLINEVRSSLKLNPYIKVIILACIFISLLFLLLLCPAFISSSPLQDPELVVKQVEISANASRRNLGFVSCGTGNPIDDCWRCDPNWHHNRRRLADCAIGFGRHTVGGRDGQTYVVTDPGDHPMNPKPGTLRYGVIQEEPLWIIFKTDMNIRLEMDLLVNSHKTIDGRGATIHIAGGPCIKIQRKTNIIIHGLHIHDCVRGNSGFVRVSPRQYRFSSRSDGDGISIFGGTHVWVDHCYLSRCYDGLIDVVHGSTAITISNNYMTHHEKVMLLGHSDSYEKDRNMQVTVAYNHFGEGLGGRMPRCRYGYFHVVNNDYSHWKHYAIGGSSNPTIFSQGNRFLAPDDGEHKEVTKHFRASDSEWKRWNWKSEGDLMLNGAFFRSSGEEGASSVYSKTVSLAARPSQFVSSITSAAGPLACSHGSFC